MNIASDKDTALMLFTGLINEGIEALFRNDEIEPPSVWNALTGKNVVCCSGFDLWNGETNFIEGGATKADADKWLRDHKETLN